MKQVIVVTNAELGWDNVVGVFNPEKVTKEQLTERFSGPWNTDKEAVAAKQEWIV